jgi:hypothetical protein
MQEGHDLLPPTGTGAGLALTMLLQDDCMKGYCSPLVHNGTYKVQGLDGTAALSLAGSRDFR